MYLVYEAFIIISATFCPFLNLLYWASPLHQVSFRHESDFWFLIWCSAFRILQPPSLLAVDSAHPLLPRDPPVGGGGGHLHAGPGGQADRAAVGSHGDGHLLLHRQHRHSSDLLFRIIPDSVAK